MNTCCCPECAENGPTYLPSTLPPITVTCMGLEVPQLLKMTFENVVGVMCSPPFTAFPASVPLTWVPAMTRWEANWIQDGATAFFEMHDLGIGGMNFTCLQLNGFMNGIGCGTHTPFTSTGPPINNLYSFYFLNMANFGCPTPMGVNFDVRVTPA